MITAASLKTYSLKDLADLAKKKGVAGWHSMRKEQLIRALQPGGDSGTKSSKSGKSKPKGGPTKAASAKVGRAESGGKKTAKPDAKKTAKADVVKRAESTKAARSAPKSDAGRDKGVKPRSDAKSSSGKAKPKPQAKPRSPQVVEKIQAIHEQRERQRDLSGGNVARSTGLAPPASAAPNGAAAAKNGDVTKDRVVLIVRDPFWLQASWEVTRQSVQRAQAAMAEQWHTARPTLRVLEVENSGTTSSAERVLREIAVHGGVHRWYIDVHDAPKSYRVDLGYLGSNGKFFSVARSNMVTTPRPGSSDAIEEDWLDVADNYEKIFALSGGYTDESSSHELQEAFEEHLQRPLGPPSGRQFGVGAERMLRRKRDFLFEVDAEMVVFGKTQADAHVSLSGEPVKLRPDGTFAVRMALPDRRQVIPVVASSRDGHEQRTIVIAVERNTKAMEPMIRESSE